MTRDTRALICFVLAAFVLAGIYSVTGEQGLALTAVLVMLAAVLLAILGDHGEDGDR